ncbi:MAG: acarbose 7IV-phosphotransferase [Chloroflexia bacterium]|jgi:ribokinase|nr:acarbose 7IV-phosphotransferase [Chloroflexia bacterium]
MPNILVSGLINLETTVLVDSFPIEYSSVRYPFFGVNTTVSGVGYNLGRALTKLGGTVTLLSLVGMDFQGKVVVDDLASHGINADFVLRTLRQTPQSAILYDRQGRRQVNTDLKDIQEQTYPLARFRAALESTGPHEIVVLTNINFSRPFLPIAHQAGKMIATDVHVISNLDDEYNADFMRYANILFMSGEALPCAPEEWAQRVVGRYGTEILVIGLGAEGALLSVKSRGLLERVPAVHAREVVSTVGAGDALFAAFVHFYAGSRDPHEALRKAMFFASYKIGTVGGAQGFLTEAELGNLMRKA